MSESARLRDNRSSSKSGSIVPALCTVLGIALIIAVIALVVPLSVPRLLGYQIYNVVSPSMEPAIPEGSVVYVKAVDPAAVEAGDVIAFHDGESVVVHRVVANRTSVGELVTKGDANNVEDLSPVPYDAVFGREEFHIPRWGSFMAIYSTAMGKIYLLLAAACGVMLNMLAGRMRERRREQEEFDAAPAQPSPRSRTGGKVVRNVFIAALAVVFLGSAGVVGYVKLERHESDAVYIDAAATYVTPNAAYGATGEGSGAQAEETVVHEPAPITVDFAALLAENPDVQGWIYCEGTPINYPVLKGETNDTYLYRSYTGAYSIDGSIFVDSANRAGFADANTIVYGHHMKSGSMFACLKRWADQAFYEVHPVIWLLTPTQNYKIVLFSMHTADAYSDLYAIIAEHGAELNSFLAEAASRSAFTPAVQLDFTDPDARYVMLSTCVDATGSNRYVLHGKLVAV